MRSLSSVGLALSVIFGCLLLALLAELYYLLWWKKRITKREIVDEYSICPSRLFYLFCWKKPSSLSATALNPQELHVHEPQALIHPHPNKALWANPFQEEGEVEETELARLQNLCHPPRFLFTIKEETKEDLESEDGKSRSRRLSDVIQTVETPFWTPLASPAYFTPPISPMDSSFNQFGFNPLYESSTDAEFNRLRSSPPPKFKFLKDAEDKLSRRKLLEEEGAKGEENGFITIIVAKNKEKEVNHPDHNSGSSHVIPLSSSPTKFRPPTYNKPFSH